MKRYIMIMGLLAIGTLAANAQPGDLGPMPTPPTGTGVPIDGGASLLAVAGGAYGVKRLRERRKAKAA